MGILLKIFIYLLSVYIHLRVSDTSDSMGLEYRKLGGACECWELSMGCLQEHISALNHSAIHPLWGYS